MAERIFCSCDVAALLNANLQLTYAVEDRQIQQAEYFTLGHICNDCTLVSIACARDLRRAYASKNPLSIAHNVEVEALLRVGSHICTGHSVRCCPACSDGFAVGFENDVQARRVAAICHAVIGNLIFICIYAVVGLVCRQCLTQDGKRRSIDIA